MRYDGKMSFRDFVFPVNPSVIRISHGKKTVSSGVLNGNDIVQDLGNSAMVISGEGEFFGENCFSDFCRLNEAMTENGGGMLYIPSQRAIFAAPDLLELVGNDKSNVIAYRFRFVEIPADADKNRERIINGNGVSCLWDIAADRGLGIDELWAANPHIRRPDVPVKPWEKVKLC